MLLFSKMHSISGPTSPLASSYAGYSNTNPDSNDAQQNPIVTMAKTNNGLLATLRLTISCIHCAVCLTTGPQHLPKPVLH
jgi:hypothetical protein